MNLTTINNIIDKIRGRTLAFFSAGNQWRRRIALFLAVIGPGIITSNVDNDAGGIATYTQAGSALSAVNASYDATIGASGGTATFGFLANDSGQDPAPAALYLNGNVCAND